MSAYCVKISKLGIFFVLIRLMMCAFSLLTGHFACIELRFRCLCAMYAGRMCSFSCLTAKALELQGLGCEG